MNAPEASAPTANEADAARERTFSIVLVGVVLLILGFTLAAIANGLYPCVPAAGSSVEPPLTDCAVSLSPWVGILIVGLALAVLGYIRAR